MSAHFPGLLNVAGEIFDNDGMPESVIQNEDGSASVAVAIDFGPNNPFMREANAARLVACWNACDGISTEKLNSGWTDTVINPCATRLEGEAKVLRGLLLLALDPLTSALKDADDTTESEMLATLIGKIEAAAGVVAANNSQVIA